MLENDSVDNANATHYRLYVIKQPADSTQEAAPREPALPTRVSSQALLGAARQLVILHNGREYVLRLTQAGKLILTA